MSYFFARPASSHRPRTASERKMALRQVVPVVPEEALQAQVVPHWAKLPKKYEQLKKKAADVKRRRKIAERQALPPSLYRSLFG